MSDDTSNAPSQEAQASQPVADAQALAPAQQQPPAVRIRKRGRPYGRESASMEREMYTQKTLFNLRMLERKIKHDLSILDTQDDNITRRALVRVKLSAELRNVLAQRADVLGIARPKPAEAAPHGVQTRRRERVLDLQPIGEA